MTLRTGLLLTLLMASGAAAVLAADATMPFSAPSDGRQGAFTDTDGRVIYQRICQGCHMADGVGAKSGPSTYPSLAANPKFAARAYPAVVVLNGLGAMPAFGTQLNDAQIAAVVNFVRGNFTNHHADTMAATDVKSLRPAAQRAPTELRGR